MCAIFIFFFRSSYSFPSSSILQCVNSEFMLAKNKVKKNEEEGERERAKKAHANWRSVEIRTQKTCAESFYLFFRFCFIPPFGSTVVLCSHAVADKGANENRGENNHRRRRRSRRSRFDVRAVVVVVVAVLVVVVKLFLLITIVYVVFCCAPNRNHRLSVFGFRTQCSRSEWCLHSFFCFISCFAYARVRLLLKVFAQYNNYDLSFSAFSFCSL